MNLASGVSLSPEGGSEWKVSPGGRRHRPRPAPPEPGVCRAVAAPPPGASPRPVRRVLGARLRGTPGVAPTRSDTHLPARTHRHYSNACGVRRVSRLRLTPYPNHQGLAPTRTPALAPLPSPPFPSEAPLRQRPGKDRKPSPSPSAPLQRAAPPRDSRLQSGCTFPVRGPSAAFLRGFWRAG